MELKSDLPEQFQYIRLRINQTNSGIEIQHLGQVYTRAESINQTNSGIEIIFRGAYSGSGTRINQTNSGIEIALMSWKELIFLVV